MQASSRHSGNSRAREAVKLAADELHGGRKFKLDGMVRSRYQAQGTCGLQTERQGVYIGRAKSRSGGSTDFKITKSRVGSAASNTPLGEKPLALVGWKRCCALPAQAKVGV